MRSAPADIIAAAMVHQSDGQPHNFGRIEHGRDQIGKEVKHDRDDTDKHFVTKAVNAK